MSKKIAVFEVEFDSDMMIDQETLNSDFHGDWLEYMTWQFREDGPGIFTEELKLVAVKELSNE